jgi:carbamate kinase
MYEKGSDRKLIGVEAVIDKDLCSELLARELDADLLILATDAQAVCTDWGKPSQKSIHKARPDDLRQFSFPAGSMGPKVDAACHFAQASGKSTAIGALADIAAMVRGERGTIISSGFTGLSWYA